LKRKSDLHPLRTLTLHKKADSATPPSARFRPLNHITPHELRLPFSERRNLKKVTVIFHRTRTCSSSDQKTKQTKDRPRSPKHIIEKNFFIVGGLRGRSFVCLGFEEKKFFEPELVPVPTKAQTNERSSTKPQTYFREKKFYCGGGFVDDGRNWNKFYPQCFPLEVSSKLKMFFDETRQGQVPSGTVRQGLESFSYLPSGMVNMPLHVLLCSGMVSLQCKETKTLSTKGVTVNFSQKRIEKNKKI
jgi:hypothetical protein